MKPIKPKPLSKSFRKWLEAVADERAAPQDFEVSDARAILSALEHAKQAGVEAEREACAQAVMVGVLPSNAGILLNAAARIRARGKVKP